MLHEEWKEGKRLLQSISSLGWLKGNSTQEKQPVLTGKNKQVSCKFDLQLLLSRPQRVAIPFSWFTRHLKWLIDPGEFWPDQGMFFFLRSSRMLSGQDGVDNTGASKDKLYSTPEDVFKAARHGDSHHHKIGWSYKAVATSKTAINHYQPPSTTKNHLLTQFCPHT